MTPIHELFNRIRWDPGFGRGEIVIGYYDRLADCIIRVPLGRVVFDRADHFACEILDDEGKAHSVPFHRIREVHKDGVLIWQRHSPLVKTTSRPREEHPIPPGRTMR